MKEEMDRHKRGSRIAQCYFEEIGARGIENQCRDHVVVCGEACCKKGSDAGAVGDDLLRGDMAGGDEVLPRGVGVVGEASLTRACGGTLAVTAIVEGEDVDAEIMKAGEGRDGVREGAVAIGEKEDGEGCVVGAGVGGYPPTGELWSSRFIGTEAD